MTVIATVPAGAAPLAASAARARRWLVEAALPFWSDAGVDRAHGGFVELFDGAGRPSADYKRVRVLARQTYVFSHAAVLGWPGALAVAGHGARFLTEHARLGPGRWARRLDRSGAVVDATPDLYDIAFVLFALAWWARASGEPAAVREALETVDALDALRRPEGGFAHVLPMQGPRLQNPHMHLLEAALALMEAAPGETRFRELADEVAGLFVTRLFDSRRGVLPEVFTDDLRPMPDASGRMFEPGHQFEWAWILRQHQRLTDARHDETCERLFASAERWGVDAATQLTFNAVRDDGLVLDRGSRVWPNTERLKGAIALQELGGPAAAPAVAGSLDVLFDRFLTPDGGWVDARDGRGAAVSVGTPASTLYHVFLAFAELGRAAGAPGLDA